MFGWLANAWRVPELRKRVLFTAGILAAYRLGSWVPAPGVDQAALQNLFNGGGILNLLNLFSGSALSRFSLFALGIMPYVTASIIVQLLTVVIPTLERLQKEGEAGYAKINQYTRYLTVGARCSAGDRLRVPLQAPAGAPERERGAPRDHHPHAHRRLRAPHVDGRADHEARHRQRHLAPHLRVDPRVRTDRHHGVDQRRHARAAVLPDHRRQRRRRRRVRAGRPAPHSRSSTRGDNSATARPPAGRRTCRCA